MQRVAIVAAIVVGAIALWLALRGSDTPTPADRPTHTMDSGASPPRTEAPADAAPVAIHATTEAPRLPAIIDAGTVAIPVDQQFATEARDPAWANTIETELRKRVGVIHDVHVDATDCHATLCKLVITGSQGAIATAIDELQTEKRGLRNWASRWTLTAPEKRGEQLALTAYVRFERPQEQPDD